MENMNKDNFWDNLFESYPKAVKEFCDFIDEYKVDNKWNSIFDRTVKFHDVPVEMQLGIWIKFLIEQGQEEFKFDDGCFDLENLYEWVSEHFHHREIFINTGK